MMYRLRNVLLLLCLLALGTSPIYAQEENPALTQSDITIEVQAGYDGHFRIGFWYPVQVIVSNAGPDVRSVLEVNHDNDAAAPFQQELELPRGARKQVQLYGIAYGFDRVANVRLLVDGQPLVQERIQLEPIISSHTFVIGVVGTDRTLLNSLGAMQVDVSGSSPSVRVVHILPELMPDRFNALEGLDMLVIHDAPADIWTPTRVQQLDLWVHMGGQLVVSGGLAGEPSLAPLHELLPAMVGAWQAARAVQPLLDLVPDQPLPTERTLSAYEVVLRDGATSLDSDALISQWQRGGGRVTLLAFDPADLRGWVGEPALWSQIVTVLPRLLPGSSLRWNDKSLLDNALHLPALTLPPVLLLLLYITVYVLVIGPMNFLILRRMHRADLAWVTIPLTVLIFVLGTYAISLLVRGVRPQLLQVNVVQSFEGFDTAHITANVGIFSPRRERYTLLMPPQSLASSRQFNVSFNETALPLRWTAQDSRFEQALVDVSSLRTFLVEQSGSLDLGIASTLERSRNTLSFSAPPDQFDTIAATVSGTIENRGPFTFDETLLVYGGAFQELGRLAPSERIAVQIDAGDPSRQFPFAIPINPMFGAINDPYAPPRPSLTQEVLFNRHQIINEIFTTPPVVTQNGWVIFDPKAVYLIGWNDQQVLPLELPNVIAQQSVETLYIVQLAVAP